jgi:hypothetical protein
MTLSTAPVADIGPATRFDVEAAVSFMAALGVAPNTCHYRAIHWDAKHEPASDRAVHLSPTFGHRREQLEQLQRRGYRLYWLPNGGPNDSDVTSCQFLFVEWDDKDLAWQTTAWQTLGLPEPTAQLATGGKSVHCYWRLREPIDPSRWRALTARLIRFCDSDPTCRNPSRLMRLAGSSYIYRDKDLAPDGTSLGGQYGPHRARLISSHPAAIYAAEEFEAGLPQLPPPPPPAAPPAAPARTSSASEPRSYAELERLVAAYPTIVANNGQRDEALKLVCGLTRCLELIGMGKADAIALASRYHPQAADTFEGVERWAFEQFDPGSFIAQCKAARVDVSRHDVPKSPRPTPPLSGDPFIPSNPHTTNGNGNGHHATAAAGGELDDEDAAAELAAAIADLRDLSAAADLATIPNVLPTGVANTITRYAEEQQLPPRGFLLPILTTAASILGDRVQVAAEPGNGWTEPAILWGVNVAEPGGGKSPTATPCTIGALTPWQARERKRHADALATWKAGLAEAQRTAKAAASESGGGGADAVADYLAANPQPQPRHLLISDTTIEQLEIILSAGASPGLLSYHDELTGWFQQLTRSAHRSDRPKWLSLYPGSALKTDRVGRDSVFVPNPCVSLFGNLQPDMLAGLWKADASNNNGCADNDGLWGRFLWYDLGDWAYHYRSSTTDLAPVLGNLYRAIDALAAQLPPRNEETNRPPVVALDSDALTTWAAWVDRLTELQAAATDGADRQYLSKQRGVTLRLALVLHAIRQASAGLTLATPIPLSTLRDAIALAALFATERQKLLAPVRSSTAGAIQRLLDRGKTWRQQHGSQPVPQKTIRSWCLPARQCPAPEVRRWLLEVVATTQGCGTVRRNGKTVEWIPPGD